MLSDDSGPLKSVTAYSTAMIANIDEGDEDDPQLASEYVTDIYRYLGLLEVLLKRFFSARSHQLYRSVVQKY